MHGCHGFVFEPVWDGRRFSLTGSKTNLRHPLIGYRDSRSQSVWQILPLYQWPGANAMANGNELVSKVNLAGKFAGFHDHWSPKIVGELNGQHVKLVKFRGEFVWHHHDLEDELFLVVKGRFRMEFPDRHVWLEEGEFLIVPRGVEHRPVADEEVHVLLFEPATTLNTGNVRDERTVDEPGRI